MKTIKIKSRNCRETLAHPGAEPGAYDGYSIFAVENVPDSASAVEVLHWLRNTYTQPGQYVVPFFGEEQS